MSLKTVCLSLFVGVAMGWAQTQVPTPSRTPGVRSITLQRVSRGWLGVGLGELTPERAKALKIASESGVEVTHVDENSPAFRAGLKEGDVITAVDGEKVTSGDQFAHTISEASPGSKVTLEIWRGGAKQSLTATLHARPLQFVSVMPTMPSMPEFPQIPFVLRDGPFSVMSMESPRIGFEGETLTPQLAEYFGVKEGVLVRTVIAKTPAEKAGLKAGDIIFRVGGTPVSNTREISGLVHSTRNPATLTVMRNHKEVTLNVEIAALQLSPEREIL